MSIAVLKGAARVKSSRWWPAGVANSLADAAVIALRGCWHRNMSWPIEVQGYKYQVCLGCGIKRLFNETTFSAYGPFRYELEELIAGTDVSSPASSEMTTPGMNTSEMTTSELTAQSVASPE